MDHYVLNVNYTFTCIIYGLWCYLKIDIYMLGMTELKGTYGLVGIHRDK